jgi:Ala-tRNA(Pro) deacylase
MVYHPLTKKIQQLLTDNQCWFETYEHPPVRTSEEAVKVRKGYTLEQGAKALIVRVKRNGEKKFVMLVVPGDKRFDKNKVQLLLASKDIRFATEEEVAKISNGVKVGGVPPFGNLFNLEVIADPSLFENEKIIFNAGDRSFSIAMLSKDYQRLVSPQIVSIS